MGIPINKVKQKVLSSQLEANANTSSRDSKAREKIETKCWDKLEPIQTISRQFLSCSSNFVHNNWIFTIN